MRNDVLIKKHFGMGYVKMHGFHDNHVYDSREWEVAYKFNHIYASTYPRALKLVSN